MPTDTPKRIQRKRTKGWKMPPNTVYVGRPTCWGNPFSVVCEKGTWFVRSASGACVLTSSPYEAHACAARLYRVYLSNEGKEPGQIRDDGGSFVARRAREELRGKNLACWCPLERACHADVLLEIAND